MINSGSAGPMLLGTFDEAKEIMRVDQKLGPQVLDSSGTCEQRALAAAPCPLARVSLNNWLLLDRQMGRSGESF